MKTIFNLFIFIFAIIASVVIFTTRLVWELPQNILGFLYFIFNLIIGKVKGINYNFSTVSIYVHLKDTNGGVPIDYSDGIFMFNEYIEYENKISKEEVDVLQNLQYSLGKVSLLLGPIFLLVYAIPLVIAIISLHKNMRKCVAQGDSPQATYEILKFTNRIPIAILLYFSKESISLQLKSLIKKQLFENKLVKLEKK